MAKISKKNVNDLSEWDSKELRKLRILLKNRISALELNPDSEIKKNHILYGKELNECGQLLRNVMKAEKSLAFASKDEEE